VYGGVRNQGPARLWEDALLGLQVEGSSAGQEGEEIAPKAKANVAAPWFVEKPWTDNFLAFLYLKKKPISQRCEKVKLSWHWVFFSHLQ
jgi:hypothetical protein